MSKKTIDEAVKGLSSTDRIVTTDLLDLSKAVYVSKSGNVEGADKKHTSTSNDKAFEEMAKKIKAEFNTPVIVGAVDATHYGFVNGNLSFYNTDFIKQNAASWVDNIDGKMIGKPVQRDHSLDTEDSLGRVLIATPFVHADSTGLSDLENPDGHIELIYTVTDSKGIEQVMDGRLQTVSVSASTSLDQVKCSICERSVASYDCEHIRGKYYSEPAEEEDGKGSKKKWKSWARDDGKALAFWIWDKKEYSEVSFVQRPADKFAANKKFTVINIPGVDAKDSTEFEGISDNSVSHFGFMFGDLKDNKIDHLIDLNGNKLTSANMITTTDSITSDSIVIDMNDTTSQEELNTPESEENNQQDNTQEEQVETTSDENIPHDYYLGLTIDFLQNDFITIDDACKYISSNLTYFYIPQKDRTSKDAIISKMRDAFDTSESDTMFMSQKDGNKKLQDRYYAGPNRSIPVFDRFCLIVAKELLSIYKGSDEVKQRIKSALDRKSNIYLTNNISNKSKQEDTQVAKFEFETQDALLSCSVVQEHIDKLKTDHEQTIDSLKKTIDEKHKSYVNLAIDSIIDLSSKLNKPLTKEILVAEKDEDKETAKNKVVEQLSSRSFESLNDKLADLRDEFVEFESEKKTKDQEQLENAINGQDSSDDDSGEEQGANDSVEGSDTESQEGEDNAGNTDELNQGDGEDAGNTSGKVYHSVLSSIIKK